MGASFRAPFQASESPECHRSLKWRNRTAGLLVAGPLSFPLASGHPAFHLLAEKDPGVKWLKGWAAVGKGDEEGEGCVGTKEDSGVRQRAQSDGVSGGG